VRRALCILPRTTFYPPVGCRRQSTLFADVMEASDRIIDCLVYVLCLVSTIPLPYRTIPYHVRLTLQFFRSVATVAVATLQGENGNAGNVFPYSLHRDEVTRTLIGCPPTAEWQKIGFDPIATERQLLRNCRWQRQRRNGIFHVGNVILTALTEFLRNVRNANGETATAERQRNGGNQALDHPTEHYSKS